MTQNNMIETSVRELLVRYNIIVPEIQREYVWGANEELLKKFFADITAGCASNQQKQDDALKSLKENLGNADPDEAIRQYYSSKYMNIGFLYSYRPFYQTNSASNKEDLYLIDGQQRFTTLFLMLVATASRVKNLQDEFRSLWQNTEGVAFDYKVRDLTHDFLNRLLEKYDGTDFGTTIFYHRRDALDPSIKNMISTLNEWQKHLDNEIKNSENAEEIIVKYYYFLMDDVRFWHFKTEKTSQGEELYITMNARGCRLAKNETVRAEMDMDPVQSKKWETVKDFFWTHRHERTDEEKGMDEFCKWLDILYKNNRVEKWEECFDALNAITEYGFFISDEEKNKYPDRFLYAKNSQGNQDELSKIDHFQLLPVLQWYIKFRSELSKLDKPTHQKRIADIIAFFKRISKTGSISKSPDEALKPALRMIEKMSDCDIAAICRLDFTDCETMKNSEELFKFDLYLNPPCVADRAMVEKLIAELDDFADGHSLEPYFYFAGSQGLETEIVDRNDFWEKLCSLKEHLYRLKLKHRENHRIFYGAFIPELYDEYSEKGGLTWKSKSDWWFARDMLSFIQDYSEDLKEENGIDKAWKRKAKAFIKEQGNDLTQVESAKSQLYLYFIYLHYIEKKEIELLYPNAGRTNFYSNDEINNDFSRCIFAKKYEFVHFNKNVPGYYDANHNPINRITIQENLRNSETWLQELLIWANVDDVDTI